MQERAPPQGVRLPTAAQASTVVEHHVDDDTGDRDVEPEGKGDARDRAVAVEAAAQRARQGDEHQRDDDHGQHGVRDEDREVERADPSGSLKADRAEVIWPSGKREFFSNLKANQIAILEEGKGTSLAKAPPSSKK